MSVVQCMYGGQGLRLAKGDGKVVAVVLGKCPVLLIERNSISMSTTVPHLQPSLEAISKTLVWCLSHSKARFVEHFPWHCSATVLIRTHAQKPQKVPR